MYYMLAFTVFIVLLVWFLIHRSQVRERQRALDRVNAYNKRLKEYDKSVAATPGRSYAPKRGTPSRVTPVVKKPMAVPRVEPTPKRDDDNDDLLTNALIGLAVSNLLSSSSSDSRREGTITSGGGGDFGGGGASGSWESSSSSDSSSSDSGSSSSND